MGLDMYLTARRSFWDYLDEGADAKRIHALFPELPEDTATSCTSVSVEFGYWRKANAIHNWFVENVQGGKDECHESYVSREDMQKLLGLVNEILTDKSLAPVYLPTRSGFFFGDTEYNEWYWQGIEHTKSILEKALDPKMKNWDFYYQSSW